MNIQNGGAKLPLYWMQGQYSTLLPRFLDPDQPLYVPIHQGLDGLPVLHKTVEEIAGHFLREIRIVQQKGPYLLGGYCLGGLVALEIAQQLLKQGDEVPLLFLLEPPSHCFPSKTPDNDPSPNNCSFRSRVAHHLGNIIHLWTGDKLDYILGKLPSVFNWILNNKLRFSERLKLLACKAYLFTGHPLPVSLRYVYLMDISMRAVRNYTPKSYPGRIILCNSDKMSYGEGVGQMTGGGVEVHQVICPDHASIVKEPYVGIWAGHLNLYLRELQVKKEDNNK